MRSSHHISSFQKTGVQLLFSYLNLNILPFLNVVVFQISGKITTIYVNGKANTALSALFVRLPKKLKKPSVILITVLSIIFSVILFKYGMDKVITQLENGKRTFVLNWPEWIFWSFVPIGAGCMILHFIEYCLDVCLGNKNDKEDK